MKFSQYIHLIENQAQKMDSMSAKQTIYTNCSDAVKSNLNMFRGMPSGFKYLHGSARFDILRRSANTSNYTTLIIDNDPAWMEYPKRSKSYICTTSQNTADAYGSIYKVYPYNGANIGICGSTDLWFSFKKLHGTDVAHINRLNSTLAAAIFYITGDKGVDTSYLTLKAACDKVDEYLVNNNYDYKAIYKTLPNMHDQALDLLLMLTQNHTPILKGLQMLLNPTDNGFKHIFLTSKTQLPHDVEVWTDSPCIFELIS